MGSYFPKHLFSYIKEPQQTNSADTLCINISSDQTHKKKKLINSILSLIILMTCIRAITESSVLLPVLLKVEPIVNLVARISPPAPINYIQELFTATIPSHKETSDFRVFTETIPSHKNNPPLG